MPESLKIALEGTYKRSDGRTIWELAWDPFEVAADDTLLHRVRVATGGTTLGFGHLISTTAMAFALKNLDPTNYVTVAWADIATTGSDSTESAHVPARGLLVLPGVSPDVNMVITANSDAVDCKYLVSQDG